MSENPQCIIRKPHFCGFLEVLQVLEFMAERVGFEPTVRYNRTLDFECDALRPDSPQTRMDSRVTVDAYSARNPHFALLLPKNPQTLFLSRRPRGRLSFV